MRISLFTHKFAPDIGGIEAMSQLLARQFVRMGHTVTVVTHTSGAVDDAEYPFDVIRRPGVVDLVKSVRDADVVFHNNICLRFLWPLLFLRRPWVVAVRTWIRRRDGSVGIRDHAKRYLLRFAAVISISKAVADHLSTASTVIPNSYRDDVFSVVKADGERDPRSIIFVGRLVKDKGAHLAVEALSQVHKRGVSATLTIVGDGPERTRLEELARRLGVSKSVRFDGALRGSAVNEAFNRHTIAVVPSVWDEPFGIVALEAVAAGCVVVATNGGGLPDAVGPCGLLVPNGDIGALTDALERVLTSDSLVADLRSGRAEHVGSHTAQQMAARYIDVIERVSESP